MADEVHSWHINPGSDGDAAIHLLTGAPTVASGGKREVLKSILIDGGKAQAYALDMVKKTIRTIRQLYYCPQFSADVGFEATMRFDSIVISHWDDDHFAGVFNLITDDLVDALTADTDNLIAESAVAWAAVFTAKNPGKVPDATDPVNVALQVTTAAGLNKASLSACNLLLPTRRAHLQSRYMKYDATKIPVAITPAMLKGSLSDVDAQSLRNSGYFQTTVYAPYDMPTHSSILKLCYGSKNCTIQVPNGKKLARTDVVAKYQLFNTCLKYVSLPANYLAVDLFSGRQVGTPATFTNPALLAATLARGKYGFFIVAGNREIIDGRPLMTPDILPVVSGIMPGIGLLSPVSTVPKKSVIPDTGSVHGHATNHSRPPSDVSEVGVINAWHAKGLAPSPGAEAHNAPSICCVLLWRPTIDPGVVSEDFKVLHYTAGDAFFDVEGALASWVTNTNTWQIRCPLMKLSHHGATASTPVQLLQALSPRCIIISTPSAAKFGHPRPETLFMLAAWYTYMKQISPDKANRGHPIYCLNYPYYFGTGIKGRSTMAPITTSTENAIQIYRNRILQYYTDSFQLFGCLWNTWVGTSTSTPSWAATRKFWKDNWSKVSLLGPPNGTSTTDYTELRSTVAIRAMFKAGDLPLVEPLEMLRDFAFTPIPSGSGVTPFLGPANNFMVMTGRVASNNNPSPASSNSPIQLGSFPVEPTAISTTAKDFALLPNDGSIISTGIDNTSGISSGIPNSTSANDGPSKFDTDDENEEDDDETASALPVAHQARTSVLSSVSRTPSAGFRVFGSNFSLREDAQNAAVLPSTSPLSGFVNALGVGCLTFDQSPASASAATMLSVKDEWYQCLLANTLGIKTIAINGATQGQSIDVSNVAATVQVYASLAVPLMFQTQTRTRALSVSRTASTKATPLPLSDAFVADYRLLVLGLDADSIQFTDTTRMSITLSELLGFFQLPWLTAAGSLPGIGDGLAFTIDADPDSRNGLFLQPSLDYPSWLRMQLRLTMSSEQAITSALPFLSGVVSGGILIHCRRSVTSERYQQEILGTHQSAVTLEIPISSTSLPKVTAWLTFGSDSLVMVLTFPTDGSTQSGDVLDWLSQNLFQTSATVHPSDLLPIPGDITFTIHQVSVSLVEQASGPLKLGNISVTFEVDIFGAIFRATLQWPQFRISADVWNEIPPAASSMNMLMLPYYEEYSLMWPTLPITGTGSLTSIVKQVSGNTQAQVNVSSQQVTETVWSAHFEAWKDSNGFVNLTFTGDIQMDVDATSNIPTVNLDLLELKATYLGSSPPVYGIELSVQMSLYPRSSSLISKNIGPATIDVSVSYVTPEWSFNLHASNLQFAVLYDLFDSDSKESVMDVLEEISIPFFDIQFDHIDGSSHFLADGSLRIHTLELDFAYEYWSAPDKRWQFQAQLGIIDPANSITIVDLIRDFDSDSEIAGLLDEVPFVKDISIPSITSAPDTFEDAPIQLTVTNTGDATVMWFQLEINSEDGNLSFLFVQHQAHSASTNAAKPKRILRVRIDKLPSIPSIPVVGQVDDPVDSIDYVLVLDSTGQNNVGTGAIAGINLEEMNAINSALQSNKQLRFRDIKSGNTDATKNYVLLAGHHFIVVANNTVILDHIFGGAKANSSQGIVASGTESATNTDSGSTMGPVSKKIGPLSINNFGLQSKDDHLWILLDATIALGPIELTLIGFGVGIPLTMNGAPISFNNLKDVSPLSFGLRLSGMSVYFDQPPVLIAGFFEKLPPSAIILESYVGGLTVSILPYTLLAVGAYTHTISPSDFKSVFTFARFDGPIVDLEFAEIRGVELGWGYNYDLTLPEVPNINNFPLVHGSNATNNPMTLLATDHDGTAPVTSFAHWTKPSEGAGWLAIGLTVDAFQILTVQAALILVFGPNNFKIAIVGMASGALPPNEKGGKPPESLLYVEFGIIAALDLFAGSLWVGAQLTPNSYVLAPDCHLTGGFALAYWFYPSPTAGDFVFSVGGYAPSYQVPPHYPICDRVGISWSIEDSLSVSGNAYLAVTPKEIMAGGELKFVFDASPFYASFTAWADFTIVYKPLFMAAAIGCSIEAGFHGSIGIIHFNLHADLDANLYLQGPPWSGRLHIHFLFISFNVNFGDQNDSPPALRWNDPDDPTKSFLSLVQQPGPGSPGKAAMCVIALEEGSVNEKTKDADASTGDVWFVRAGTFKFHLESKVPIKEMNYDDGHDNTIRNGAGMAQDNAVAGSVNPIYAFPMQVSREIKSILTFKIQTNDQAIDPRAKIANSWLYSPITRNVPRALWDQYPSSPTYPGGSNTNTITHTMGYTFLTPNPLTPETPTTAFTFNAALSMSEGVFPDGVGCARNDKRPLFDPTTPDQRPRLHPTPPVQSADLPLPMTRDSVLDDEWAAVAAAWKSADPTVASGGEETAGQGFVDAWTNTMGWKAGAGLVAAMPKALVADFETFYLGCPWLTNAPVM